jgi:hypothetical protein
MSNIIKNSISKVIDYQKDTYIKPFTNFSLDNFKTRIKTAIDAPKDIYNTLTNQTVGRGQEKEITDGRFKGLTSSELGDRLNSGRIINKQGKTNEFFQGLGIRQELMKRQDESATLLSIAVAKKLI